MDSSPRVVSGGTVFLRKIRRLQQLLYASRYGIPVRDRDLVHVQLGPSFRCGAIDLNGRETVGGVDLMLNNAGLIPLASLEELKTEEWK